MASAALADTTGPEALSDWLARQGLNQREGAVRLGLHWTMLNHILRRRNSPSLTLALHIERQTGIPVREWDATHVDKRTYAGKRTGRKR